MTFLFSTALGPLTGIISNVGLRSLSLQKPQAPNVPSKEIATAQMRSTYNLMFEWLTQYFAGNFHSLPAIPLDLVGGHFELQVWKMMGKIPCGQTCSYGELARLTGQAKAARAVGSAVGRNPILIINPCHRVIGADGTLTGFSGGLEVKQRLLMHEGLHVTGRLPRSRVYPCVQESKRMGVAVAGQNS